MQLAEDIQWDECATLRSGARRARAATSIGAASFRGYSCNDKVGSHLRC